MKIHQITEASTPNSVDIKPGILDPKGNKIFNVVDQNGKILKSFTGASAEADANAHRDKLTKQIADKRAKIKAPPAPGTPTRDQLSKGQQRKLARTGKLNYKGKTYTTKQIAKATVQAKNLSKVKTPDLDNTRDSGTKKTDAKGLFQKLKNKMPEKLINWMRTHLSRLFGATVAGWVLKSFAISGIVSLYNSYFDEIYTLVEAKENGAKDDVLKGIAKKMGSIRSKLIEETTNLMIGSIGMAFGTGGVLVGGMVVGAVATFFTGGAAAPPSILWGIFVGAVAAYGAYEGAMMVCKMESAGKLIGLDVSIYDYTKNKLGTTWLTPDMLADTLREVGAEQTFIKYVIGLTTNPLMQWSSPGAIPGINSGFSIGGAVSAPLGAVKDMIDHKDHSDLNRIMELSGVVQETKLKKIKLDDLPDELKKLAIIGAKTIQKANKEKKST